MSTSEEIFEKIYETLPGDGWLTRDEAKLLWEWVNKSQGPILEVGCYRGRSTCLLAATGRPVHAVDPFNSFSSEDPTGDNTESQLIANLESRGLRNVTIYRQRIEDWHATPVGFAYLDGDHTYRGTLAQLRKALECRADHIAVHDVNDQGGGLEVKRACIELFGRWQERVGRLAVWGAR